MTSEASIEWLIATATAYRASMKEILHASSKVGSLSEQAIGLFKLFGFGVKNFAINLGRGNRMDKPKKI